MPASKPTSETATTKAAASSTLKATDNIDPAAGENAPTNHPASKEAMTKAAGSDGIVLDSKIPAGPLDQKWDMHKQHLGLIAPANRRKFNVIVVGTGLAGASAAASLAEMGYGVKSFCIQDSPRRAHSVAAQGGINAAKNYQNDGDSIWRLFKDTIKGGDFRSREANVQRLAQVSTNIIDQCVAQGVPFAREYSGLLANRTFGGVQVSRTFYARGQTGQQLLYGAFGALMRQVDKGAVELFPRREMLDLVLHNGQARGIVVRNLVTGALERHEADAVVLCTGGYSTVFYLSTNAINCNATAAWRCHRRGALFANPCYTQIHPTCIPRMAEGQSKLTLMSESLRNDGRVWVPAKKGDFRPPNDIPESERDYYLERQYPAFGNMVPRDIASRAAKTRCDEGHSVMEKTNAVYLDFASAIERHGEDTIRARYGNLFDIYEEITGENPYKVPMKIFPAPHYTMGGLWVDYNLMTNIPGLFSLGEANFSDHGANRLGASALMQGLADGYFVIPHTIGDYLSSQTFAPVDTEMAEFDLAEQEIRGRMNRLLDIGGTRTATDFHQELGNIMWETVGMARGSEGLKQTLKDIPELRKQFYADLKIPGGPDEYNKQLEIAGRVEDYLELGELMAQDALTREESAGGHFRIEHEVDGEAKRDDENFCHVSAWEYQEDKPSKLHKEALEFESVELVQRSYK